MLKFLLLFLIVILLKLLLKWALKGLKPTSCRLIDCQIRSLGCWGLNRLWWPGCRSDQFLIYDWSREWSYDRLLIWLVRSESATVCSACSQVMLEACERVVCVLDRSALSTWKNSCFVAGASSVILRRCVIVSDEVLIFWALALLLTSLFVSQKDALC